MSAHKDPNSHVSIIENGDGVNIEWTFQRGDERKLMASVEGTLPPLYPLKRESASIQTTRSFNQPMRHRRHAR